MYIQTRMYYAVFVRLWCGLYTALGVVVLRTQYGLYAPSLLRLCKFCVTSIQYFCDFSATFMCLSHKQKRTWVAAYGRNESAGGSVSTVLILLTYVTLNSDSRYLLSWLRAYCAELGFTALAYLLVYNPELRSAVLTSLLVYHSKLRSAVLTCLCAYHADLRLLPYLLTSSKLYRDRCFFFLFLYRTQGKFQLHIEEHILVVRQ